MHTYTYNRSRGCALSTYAPNLAEYTRLDSVSSSAPLPFPLMLVAHGDRTCRVRRRMALRAIVATSVGAC